MIAAAAAPYTSPTTLVEPRGCPSPGTFDRMNEYVTVLDAWQYAVLDAWPYAGQHPTQAAGTKLQVFPWHGMLNGHVELRINQIFAFQIVFFLTRPQIAQLHSFTPPHGRYTAYRDRSPFRRAKGAFAEHLLRISRLCRARRPYSRHRAWLKVRGGAVAYSHTFVAGAGWLWRRGCRRGSRHAAGRHLR